MKHLKKGRKFGREKDQREALMRSLASSFFVLGRIRTTEAKAKELRSWAERFITRAKSQTLADGRILYRNFGSDAVHKLLERAKDYKQRPGGYTRIVKIGPRKSDGARMAIIELVKS